MCCTWVGGGWLGCVGPVQSKFRQQQQAELQALLKRIDARRKEHVKQRNLDSKRSAARRRRRTNNHSQDAAVLG